MGNACPKPKIDSNEAFRRVKQRRAVKNVPSVNSTGPQISGSAAASLVVEMKKMDSFKARSLSKNGKKVIR